MAEVCTDCTDCPDVSDAELDELCGEYLEQLLPREVFRQVVMLRRTFHREPELAFHEVETAKKVRAELAGIEGVEVLSCAAGGTGVLAILQGTAEGACGHTILFRADMDALPVAEAEPDDNPHAAEKRQKLLCCALCGGPSAFARGAAAFSSSGSSTTSIAKPARSSVAGVSHACGHDGHMAMLLGAARLLAARRHELAGRLVLLFQPAEERHPLSNPKGGAIRMIRDLQAGEQLATCLGVGSAALSAARARQAAHSTDELHAADGDDCSMDSALLEGVDEVYGAHLWNYASAGTIGCAAGSVTANSDSLEFVVHGTGGHASAPQGTVDALVVAADLISALQKIISRNVSPTESHLQESAVITLGKIDGGFAPNVIATSVRILGTVRTYTQPVKSLVRRRIREVAAGVAASHGANCTIDVKYTDGYPACVNERACAASVGEAATAMLGERLVGAPSPNMAGEDFAFFLSRKPGAFFFIGSNPLAPFVMDPALPVEAPEAEHGERRVIAHHTPEFDLHEGALAVGTAMWCALARHRLCPPTVREDVPAQP